MAAHHRLLMSDQSPALRTSDSRENLGLLKQSRPPELRGYREKLENRNSWAQRGMETPSPYRPVLGYLPVSRPGAAAVCSRLIPATRFFSPPFIYFPPLRFNPVSWEIPAEIYSLLRCFFSLVPWLPDPVWLRFVPGMGGKQQERRTVHSVGWVEVPYRCYTPVGSAPVPQRLG